MSTDLLVAASLAVIGITAFWWGVVSYRRAEGVMVRKALQRGFIGLLLLGAAIKIGLEQLLG